MQLKRTAIAASLVAAAGTIAYFATRSPAPEAPAVAPIAPAAAPKTPCALTAYVPPAPPHQVNVDWQPYPSGEAEVGWIDRATLAWSPYKDPGAGVVYDVLFGAIGDWSGGCLSAGSALTTETVPDPMPGYGAWYVVRARNQCGASTWGWATSGERVSAGCGP